MTTILHTREPMRLLLLGGTIEAAELARRLAGAENIRATLSLAGRTANPPAMPLPTRVGGFGGAEGLADYLAREEIDLVVDATHPFADQISGNAIRACAIAGIALVAVERPPWEKRDGDDWIEHASVQDLVAALPEAPQRIFSGLGRQAIGALMQAPQHHYVIRVVDDVAPPPQLPHAKMIAARGPFRAEDDEALFRAQAIACVLAKNAGGSAAYAKIEAARRLGIPVHIVRRPAIGARPVVASVDAAMAAIALHQSSRSKRGV